MSLAASSKSAIKVWFSKDVMHWVIIGTIVAAHCLLLSGPQALTVWVIKRQAHLSLWGTEQGGTCRVEIRPQRAWRTLANLRVDLGRPIGLVDLDFLDKDRQIIPDSAKRDPPADSEVVNITLQQDSPIEYSSLGTHSYAILPSICRRNALGLSSSPVETLHHLGKIFR